MTDITVIILTRDEEKHIERCVRSAQSIASRVVVVDSFSSDLTMEIARAMGADVVQRKFINQADQLQWAVENCAITTFWVMRMDADEYLESSLVKEIQETLLQIPSDVDGIYIKLKVFFMGQWIYHGGFYPFILLRIWRKSKGYVEQRWMDERVVLQPNAKSIMLHGNLIDDNQKGITFWINKHNSYASREMAEVLIGKYFLASKDHALWRMTDNPHVLRKRIVKEGVYNKLPLVWRAVFYFFYRYILLLGFLDGGKGFVWHFLQGFWYRLLVDIKIIEVESRAQGDKEKIKTILKDDYGIEL